VEIVKGPASVFFGQGYPGGVINYITKRPQFSKIPTTFSYQINSNSGQKLVVDHNAMLSKKAAFRIVGAWEDTQGERRFEYRKNVNITPSLTLRPTDKLTITLELEYLKERFNQNDYDWIFSDWAGWKAAHGTVGSSRYTNYAAYIADKRTSTGNLSMPAYTTIERGAYYTDASGNVIKDDGFNYTSRGAYTENEVETFSVQADFAPFEWLDGRYVYTNDNSRYDSVEGLTTPYADAMHWNVNAGSTAGYYRITETHQLDLIFKFDLFGISNKLLAGYQRSDYIQQYNSNDPLFTRWYGHVPGVTNAIANPGGAAAILGGSGGQVPVNQVIRDRNGNIKTISQVYSNFDPGFEEYPDISVVLPVDRVLLDAYKPLISGAYLNWQASLLDNRLDVIAGYRREWRQEEGQFLITNFPWYITPPTAWEDTVTYPENVWSYSKNYSKTNWYKQHGDSWMGGASFALTKEINLYASISKTFKFNTGTKSGIWPGDEVQVYQSALNHGGGSYQYLGQTITSTAQAIASQAARGAYDNVDNESGMNWEVGAKMSTEDNKIVGTVSFFRAERTNQRLDDGAKQSNAEEPYNYSTTLFTPGTIGYNTRNFRWRTTELKNRIEGAEAEVIWTPMRNYQAVINGSWLWTAKTVYDKTRFAPGTAGYNNYSAAAKIAADIYYNARIENVPEYRLNMFHKYTFTDGPARGASIGLGIRYSSETVISRSVDWNPLNGGAQSGDYLVFDVTASYPWELLGYKIKSSIGIYNATDEDYMEGRNVFSPARNWLFTNTVTF
ncbi:MAG: TonB-dependent receptor, partial [Cephaloticoccus sp.]|nr:TonB-dependent receptor [Cephaloticoccus sp.]